MAGVALLYLHDFGGFWEVLCEIEQRQGFKALSEPQQVYFAVHMYDAEVRNGGHVQYFGNSIGEHWREAIYGRRLIGAPQKAQILEQAIGVYGPGGPPANRKKRRDIAYNLADSQEKLLRGLDQRYYDDAESVDALLSVYAVDRNDTFERRG